MSRRKYIVFLIIEAVVCAIAVLIKSAVGKATDGVFTLSSVNASLTVMSLFLQILLPIVVMMAVCDLFATEYQDGTIKATLIRPVSRFKIYISKIFACLTVAAANIVVVVTFSNLLEAFVTGGVHGVGYAFAAYLIDIVPLFVVLLMAVLINQIGKSSTLAMFLCIIVYMVLWAVGVFIPHMSGLLFTGYMEWHKLWIGVIQPLSSILSKTGLLVGYGLIFFSAGYYLFLNRE